MMMSKGYVRDPKELTRAQIIRAAGNFADQKGMKWTVIVGDRELPARPLVLEAAGVPPNDPTNSHQAVEILRRLGFETRYAREQPEVRAKNEEAAPQVEKGLSSILEISLCCDEAGAGQRVGTPSGQIWPKMPIIIFMEPRRMNEADFR